MITLALDTSFHFLTLVLYRNEALIASLQKEAYKQQSETILSELDRLFKQAGIEPQEINQLVVTSGPGSYTGLRIAMTIVKILGSIAPIQVFTLSSLQVLSGKYPQASVLIDARAQRVYFARYEEGRSVIEDCILPLEEARVLISPKDLLIGEGHLLGNADHWPDYRQHFMQLKDYWEPVESIHLLVPRYLKEHNATRP